MSFVLFLVWVAVSEADLLVESQLCGIVSPKGLFGVVSSFSTVLFFQVISVAGALNLRLI
ncbi:hypothetical protein [Vibrio parahaemolyticus]|uniref:hypothetical protein n=1 Tax=Vibrio parahaemolyticus TaxID=670 RepID=UPI002151B846|nr:hypothetical protein [Vibrio parahaemolyticus]